MQSLPPPHDGDMVDEQAPQQLTSNEKPVTSTKLSLSMSQVEPQPPPNIVSARSHVTASSRQRSVVPSLQSTQVGLRAPPGTKPTAFFTTKKDDDSSSTSSSDDDDDQSTKITSTTETSGSSTVEEDGLNSGEDQTCLTTCFSLARRAVERLMHRPKNKKECLDHDSLFVFDTENQFRIVVYNIVHHRIFEGFVILVILMNCVMLALDDPTTTTEPSYQSGLNMFFLVTFTVEMILKFIAFGAALHEGAYFRSGWNVLDFIIVVLSFLQLIPGFGNFTAFRTMRVLRPLRSMNAIPQLKTIATCLVHSVKGLANVFLLAMFFYCVFAIFATQLWMGNLRYRCAYDYDGFVETDMFCTQTSGGSVVGTYCPDGMSCVEFENPNNGYTSFDSVLWALLVVFQTITLEGWAELMYLSMDSCGWPAAIFFVLVVIIGSYFVLNLCLAVISFHFTNVKERMTQKEIEQVKSEEMELRKTEEGMLRARASLRLQPGGMEALLQQTVADSCTHVTGSDVHRVLDARDLSSMSTPDRYHLAKQLRQTAAGSLITVTSREELFDLGEMELGSTHRSHADMIKMYPEFGPFDDLVVKLYRVRLFVFELVEGLAYENHMECIRKIEVNKLRLIGKTEEAEQLLASVPDSDITIFGKCIYACIIMNTIVLAASHFNESEMQTEVSGVFNIVFSALFVLEMLLKIFCMGPIWYVSDSFNIFDGIVTIVSLVEIAALNGSSTFSVFRAFRMLRVLRLLQGIPSLRQLIEVFGLALNECGYLFVILALYFLMSALVGMQFFADSLQTNGIPDDPVRSSFASFPRAFYTMMQVITYDSWPNIMWNAMNATSLGAAVFFIACIFIGNLCVLNLLVAILIDSFEQYAKKHSKKDKRGTTVSESDSDDEGAPMVRRGIAVKILKAEPFAPATTLLPRGANEFLTKEIDTAPQELTILQEHRMSQLQHADAAPTAAISQEEEKQHELLSIEKVPSIDAEPIAICDFCGDPLIEPFPPISMSIAPISAQELHERVCERIQFRKIKERVIQNLIRSMTSLDTDSDDDDDDDVCSPGPGSFMSFGKAPPPPVPHMRNGSFSTNPFAAPTESGEFESPFHNMMGNAPKENKHRNGTGRFPTPANIEDVFGRAWEVGLLLGDNVSDYVHCQSWGPVKKLLRTEYALLQLKIGEEQIGRALTAYTRANVPHQILTNGGVSLFLFGPRHWLRVQLTALVTWAPFDYFILAVIFASSVLMALENPSNSEAMQDQLDTAGRVFTVIFCVEMLVKVIAFGFVFIENAYLRDPWNWLDFLVVVVSVGSWVMEEYTDSKVSALKVLRTLRVMRPLRLINRNRGLRMVVLTLLQSVKGIANITLILVLVFLIFAILGVQLFGGILWSCNDDSIDLRVECVGTYFNNFTEPGILEVNQTLANGSWVLQNVTARVNRSVVEEREWVNSAFHFDDTLSAFIALFHVATLDDWGVTMYDVIDGVDFNHGPRPWENTLFGLYFVAFIMVGGMFLLNMFIGLIIENFQSTKAHMDGVGLLTDDQRLWVETQRMMLNFRPQRLKVAGSLKFQQSLAHLAEETWFELLSAGVVLANVVVIAISHHNEPPDLTVALAELNIVFTVLFIVEAIIKIAAYDHRYFGDGWNRFDFFIVCLGILDISTDSSFMPINVGLIRVFRVFRIARILALVRKARDIRVLLETLWYSIPSLANIGAFMFLVIFIFTVMGVQIWGSVRRDGEGLTAHTNFEDFGTAFLFLIQVTTLDDWGQTMTSLTIVDKCGPETDPNGIDHCGSTLAPLFFIPFILISSYVMVNLFCAIILDNFSTTMELDKSHLKVSDLKKFADAWAFFDPDATMLTKTKNFPNLLAALKPPLGIERTTDRKELLKITMGYVIPEHEGEIHFVETLIPLARKVLGVTFTDEEIREHEELWKMQFPDLNQLRVIRYRQKRVTVDQYFAATYIAGAFRRRLARKVAARMRCDKREDLMTWYEDRDIPRESWHAIDRMDREEEQRVLTMKANKRMIEAVVSRGRTGSVVGLEDEEEIVDSDQHAAETTATVVGLLASLAQNENQNQNAAAAPNQQSAHPLLGRKVSLARRESMKPSKRRQSLGLSGFTQLWAKHAAEL